MTIDELLPSLGALSDAEKIRLAQAVLQQLAQEQAESAKPTSQRFACDNPLKGSVTFEKDIVSPIGDAGRKGSARFEHGRAGLDRLGAAATAIPVTVYRIA